MKNKSYIVSIAVLVAASALLYFFQLRIFHDPKNTYFYFFQDIAFLPISVLFVTYIIDKLITSRERNQIMEKLNHVIGIFYSELGRKMLLTIKELDTNSENLAKIFSSTENLTQERFDEIFKLVSAHEFRIKADDTAKLGRLKLLLSDRRDFLVRLLENQSLLEHETFTDLIMSTFHILEELTERLNAPHLPDDDLKHIENDIKRMFGFLLPDWIKYLKYLQRSYPYLYKFAIETNPLKK